MMNNNHESKENGSKQHLLLVDDEPYILNAIERVFRRSNYIVTKASSANDALKILNSPANGPDIGVIISDYRMPGMDGIEFLKTVTKNHPDVMRILITGQADMESVIDGVNEGAIYRILEKPCDNDHLIETARQAFDHQKLLREKRQLTEELKDANRKLENANKELQSLNANLATQVKDKSAELEHAKYFDNITGLPTRTLITDKLNGLILSNKGRQESLTIMFVGIDHFKIVNESLGYETGNELLKIVSKRISNCLEEEDLVARMNGDEFCVLIANKNSKKDPSKTAQKLLDTISEPLKIKNQELFLSASIGISIYPENGKKAEDLFTCAETAMYKVKSNGRSNYDYFSDEFRQLSENRLFLESELRSALKNKEFLLYYQPRIDIEHNKIIAAEALLRWQHPSRGLVPPGGFLPTLESSSLIEQVGDWVIQEACEAMQRWNKLGLPPIQVSVNLSARQFANSNLEDKILQIAKDIDFELSSGQLELEITESLLMEDIATAQKTLKALHDMGIPIAIDDFGTGYSSLNYLVQLPLNYLKIDRSFVIDIEKKPEAKVVAESIVGLAHNLYLKVIAEGVETQEQIHILKSIGCKECQGYIFSRPVPENELIKLLQNNQCLPDKESNSIETQIIAAS